MIPPLSSVTAREAVWLFPVAIAIHFSEEAPRFAKWARMHISPLYTNAHWRKIHGMGLVSALIFAALVSLWPRPVSVFLFLALYLSPMVFNAVFHITASVFYRSYSPGAVSAALLFPTLFLHLGRLFSQAGLLRTEVAMLATAIGAVVHMFDLASTTFFVRKQPFRKVMP
jgi:hypothetical protein